MADAVICPLCESPVAPDVSGTPPLYSCTVCGTWFQWPQPAPEDLAHYYDEVLDTTYLFKYSAIAGARAYLHNSYVENLVETKRIIDVGCGTGDYLAFFLERAWTCKGLEISSTLAQTARDHHGLDVVTDDFMGHSFDEKYGAVSAQHVLEHMNDPVAFVRKAHGLLTDSGFMLLAVPNHDSLLQKWVGSAWLCRAEESHLFHFTRKSILWLAEQVGFRPLVCTTWQYEMADVLWALKKRLAERPDPASPQVPAEATKGGRDERESERTARRGTLQRGIVAAAGTLRPWINRSGGGAEVIAVLQKK